MLLRLRQCCDHLKLVEAAFDEEDAVRAPNAMMRTQSQSNAGVNAMFRTQAQTQAQAQDARCELCCDFLENATLAPCCRKCFCRECILVGLLSMKGNYKHQYFIIHYGCSNWN